MAFIDDATACAAGDLEACRRLEGTGGGQTQTTVQPGQVIYRQDGSSFQVQQIRSDGKVVVAAQLPDGTMGTTVLRPGTYATLGGQVLDVAQNGVITGSRTMSAAERAQFNLPFSGDPGNGGGPVVTGAAAPDPAGALNAYANIFRTLVESDQIPFNQAVQEFNRWAGIVGLQAEQSGQQLAQAQSIETGQREREIARSSTQLGAQQERGARAGEARQLLRSSIPQGVKLSVPLLGDISPLGTQVNPDQFFDIPGLNAIQLPGAQTAGQLQNFQPFDVNAAQAPGLPQGNITQPPISMEQVLALVQQAAQGFPGFVVG